MLILRRTSFLFSDHGFLSCGKRHGLLWWFCGFRKVNGWCEAFCNLAKVGIKIKVAFLCVCMRPKEWLSVIASLIDYFVIKSSNQYISALLNLSSLGREGGYVQPTSGLVLPWSPEPADSICG